MKTNATSLKRSLLLATFSCIVWSSMQAQPDYTFKNPLLISGTSLQQGAVYRYSSVKPGFDAIMTLTFISPGVTVQELDGTSGYPEAIQPTLNLPPWTTGYLEMNIQFVTAGTTDPATQPEVSATCIDVDALPNADGAGNTVYEFDQIDLGGGYYEEQTAGGELSVSQTGNWITGTNIAGIDYPGRDTAARAVMFTSINNNVTDMTIRVGVINQTGANASRLRSVYFKRFVYNNSVMSLHDGVVRPGKAKPVTNSSFKVAPSVITGSARMAIVAQKDGWALLELIDFSGRKMLAQQLVVSKGSNTIPLFDLNRLSKGNYFAVLHLEGKTLNQKLVKL